MLSGKEIACRIQTGEIMICPFNVENLNPNSYNLSLGDTLLVYDLGNDGVLDARKENNVREIKIPEDGYVLQPGILYLGSTQEICGSDKYVAMISGRSTYARLGITIHQTAGYSNVGHYFRWTLEISVIHPVRIYPGMKICQVSFENIDGVDGDPYDGKYVDSVNTTKPGKSKSYLDKN